LKQAANILVIFSLLFVACKPQTDELILPENQPYLLQLPDHFPEIPVPADNPLSVDAVELGRLLFHDTRLSRDGLVSCATCHLQHLAFSDGQALSTGIEGRTGLRNAPSLANVAYAPRLFADGGVPSLELQVLAPIADVNEMDHNILLAAEELDQDPVLHQLAMSAFQQGLTPYTITRALASFERTLVSTDSKYDQYLSGTMSLSEDEMEGMALFMSDELKCASCHSGALFSNFDYVNIGLYSEYTDAGRERITLNQEDLGKFKTPSLRNVALTAPYMHDGSMESLEEVIDFFASGGENHINKDPRIAGFQLSDEDKNKLIAFLHALSDETLLQNPSYFP
jgi:cytochrome c peroxidase